MNTPYPAGPDKVPENLTEPTATYKRHVWFALAGLVAFVLIYLAFAGAFSWIAWKMARAIFSPNGSDDNLVVMVIVGVSSAFLALFMFKALFFRRNTDKSKDYEVTPAQEPRLFEFLHKLADEAGAPRPHRVTISAEVNASVSYDLSIINLLWPTKKNLNIGLGLVNVLTLSEFKAVCAHEFGHFAQSTMAIGRWVYVAQKIASDIVHKRDSFDAFLGGIARFDLRIAWLGWLLQLIVWSIRSLMDTVFHVVVLAQRALSREMEMQADLVAVSLTGSDALINALHKLSAADQAWSRTRGFVDSQLRQKHSTQDAFAIQSRIITLMGQIQDDPFYGKEPAAPMGDPAKHRVFEVDLAQAPSMWSTHPHNYAREENAKRRYISAPTDLRSAWDIFDSPQTLREAITAQMCKEGEDCKLIPMEESLAALNEQYEHECYNRAYRGAYLWRSPVLHTEKVADLYSNRGISIADAAKLYPENLSETLTELRALEKELALLKALKEGLFVPTDGVIRHRGQTLQKRQIPNAIKDVEAEAGKLRQTVHEHDLCARTVHRLMAKELGQGWEDYLVGLASVLHYAAHAQANTRDAFDNLNHAINVATLSNKVSARGRADVMHAAMQLHRCLNEVFQQAPDVRLDMLLHARWLKTLISKENPLKQTWANVLGQFDLPAPTEDALDQWLRAANSWTGAVCSLLSTLEESALDELLSAELTIAKYWREEAPSLPAPVASKAPAEYATMTPGSERKREAKVSAWQRFHAAQGVFSTIARLLVAASIVGAVLGFGFYANTYMANATVVIYNGLNRSVKVQIGSEKTDLSLGQRREITVPEGEHTVTTTDFNGHVIETFQAKVERLHGTIYNVAGASPLTEWSVIYSINQSESEEPKSSERGAPRWLESYANYLFVEPPKSISMPKGRSSTTRSLLEGYTNLHPRVLLNKIQDQTQLKPLAYAHARWDGPHSRYLQEWIWTYSALSSPKEVDQLLADRLLDNPDDVIAMREQQDNASDQARVTLCNDIKQRAQGAPTNSNLQYVAIRCEPHDEQQNAQYLAGREKWPKNPWFAYASGYVHAEKSDWRKAREALEYAATQMPEVSDRAWVNIVRLQRMERRNTAVENAPESFSLNIMLAYENGENGAPATYALLNKGKLEAALAQTTPESRPSVLWFVAASEGASAQRIAEALAQKADTLNAYTIWSALALAEREHKDTSPYIAWLKKDSRASSQKGIAQMLTFLELVREGKTALAEKSIATEPLEMRGHAYAMGLILLRNKAPQSWREDVKLLLFASERPYFVASPRNGSTNPNVWINKSPPFPG